ncbi:HP0838 family lipoprotein [Helicobacter felis]|uniref:HP0838 family lipoprotein n=1 Tax=Helicobacter felis TaxID=214 RepID=UPI000CF0C097|nr:hypothetical protein [Helicobacter felis]
MAIFSKTFFIALSLGLFFAACGHKTPKPKKTSKHEKVSKPKPKKLSKQEQEQQRKAQEAEARKKALEQFKLIYIYTPVFRFYDYGTIGHDLEGNVQLTLYKLSKKIGTITIKKSYLCFSSTCSPKWTAAKDMFGSVSYANLFDDIVLGHDIFKGVGKRIEPNGDLIQRFVQNGQVVYYERKPGKILFQNMSANIAVVIEQYHP